MDEWTVVFLKQSTLMEDVKRIKSILVGIATGTRIENPIQLEYEQIRQKLISDPQVKKFLPEFLISCRHLNEFWGFIKPKFSTYAERRLFLTEQFNQLLSEIETGSLSASSLATDEKVSTSLQTLDSESVNGIWKKAIDRRSTDPEGALTIARTLMESVIKHILDDLHEPYGEKDKLPTVYFKMASRLNLTPNTQTEEMFKKLLGGCQSLVEGIGTIRNKLSDAHGKGRNHLQLDERYVEFVVNMAGILAIFWINTYKEIYKN